MQQLAKIKIRKPVRTLFIAALLWTSGAVHSNAYDDSLVSVDLGCSDFLGGLGNFGSISDLLGSFQVGSCRITTSVDTEVEKCMSKIKSKVFNGQKVFGKAEFKIGCNETPNPVSTLDAIEEKIVLGGNMFMGREILKDSGTGKIRKLASTTLATKRQIYEAGGELSMTSDYVNDLIVGSVGGAKDKVICALLPVATLAMACDLQNSVNASQKKAKKLIINEKTRLDAYQKEAMLATMTTKGLHFTSEKRAQRISMATRDKYRALSEKTMAEDALFMAMFNALGQHMAGNRASSLRASGIINTGGYDKIMAKETQKRVERLMKRKERMTP